MADETTREMVAYTMKVDRRLLDRFREVAESEHRSAVQQFRVLMERTVQEFDDRQLDAERRAA
jgi:hypothetical protein